MIIAGIRPPGYAELARLRDERANAAVAKEEQSPDGGLPAPRRSTDDVDPTAATVDEDSAD